MDAELVQRRKGDPGMVHIAGRLRQETTITLRWIADQIQKGAGTHVSNLPGKRRGQRAKKRKPRQEPFEALVDRELHRPIAPQRWLPSKVCHDRREQVVHDASAGSIDR